MLTITDGGSLTRALKSPLNHGIKVLLARRCGQLGGNIEGQARFIIAEPGDPLTVINEALGFEVTQNVVDGSRFGEREFTPSWEWLQNHCNCFELCFIFDDSGSAHVLIVEKAAGIDPQLRRLCSMYSSEHA